MVLVTGGTGFIAIHTILLLLHKGFKVRTTLRNLNRRSEVIEMLKNGGEDSFDNIEFIEADLMKDDNWAKAVRNCKFVLHIASPLPVREPKNANELILPAREGTLRVLKAAGNAGVKRVVMTSSIAAIGSGMSPENHIFTEDDWTDPNSNISAYAKSKTLAELAAWDFINNQDSSLELTVINPVVVLGPVLGKDFSNSIQIVEQLMTGKIPAIPKINLGVVDVRDVADIHIRAMTSPEAKGQRFIASSGSSISLPEIAGILRSQQNRFARKVTRWIMPDWMVKLAAFFIPDMKPVVFQLGKSKVISNEKAKMLLGWQPGSTEASVFDTAESLIKLGIIK